MLWQRMLPEGFVSANLCSDSLCFDDCLSSDCLCSDCSDSLCSECLCSYGLCSDGVALTAAMPKSSRRTALRIEAAAAAEKRHPLVGRPLVACWTT